MALAPKKPGPDTPSLDYKAMEPYWCQVQTILDGADAMREAGEKYLPRFPKESAKNYKHRRKNAKFTNVFRDICENLASKPFAKECGLKDGSKVGDQLKGFVADVDASGNSMHVFAGEVFFNGIAKALDWIFVDYTRIPDGVVTLAQEKAMGARPYWVRLKTERIIAARCEMIEGKEQFVHVRIAEPTTVVNGYEEEVRERVREYNRIKLEFVDDRGTPGVVWTNPMWQLWEKQQDPNTKEIVWVVIDSGMLRIPVIPLVPYLTGRRKGSSWCLFAPMEGAADLQVEHYQQETNLKAGKEQACFPMLAGQGISPPKGKDGKAIEIETGPCTVLYSEMASDGNAGQWAYVQPSAETYKFLAEDVKRTEQQLRELGRQPLTAQTGNLTVVTTAFAASKGNSAVQAWALNLKDALTRALELTMLWLEDTTSKPEVFVFTDFGVDLQDGTSMERLITMAKDGKLSDETLRAEAVRRGELAADFDEEREKRLIREQGPDPDSEDDLAAARTPPLRVAA